MINDVLDLSKSEAGKMALNTRQLDMSEVLNDCTAMVREQCIDAGLVLETSGLDQALAMTGDAAKLRQVFLNLLSNAIKFTEKGGLVTLSAAATPDGVAVAVTDTGIGMDPADIDIAFQPFGQVDNRLERRYEGTGLGLPLTKALVDLHRGLHRHARQRHAASARAGYHHLPPCRCRGRMNWPKRWSAPVVYLAGATVPAYSPSDGWCIRLRRYVPWPSGWPALLNPTGSAIWGWSRYPRPCLRS